MFFSRSFMEYGDIYTLETWKPTKWYTLKGWTLKLIFVKKINKRVNVIIYISKAIKVEQDPSGRLECPIPNLMLIASPT